MKIKMDRAEKNIYRIFLIIKEYLKFKFKFNKK